METQTIHSCFQLRIFITIIADPANNQPLAILFHNCDGIWLVDITVFVD